MHEKLLFSKGFFVVLLFLFLRKKKKKKMAKLSNFTVKTKIHF